ncbi:TonB-dependent receptor [Candidatus Dependentiae bacterium]|nr:TonB-dependent receptor [Candidatus Dependentiae bacterium]
MKKILVVFMLSFLFIMYVGAIDETLLFSEDELVTVATKTPKKFKDVPASMTIITQAQIQAMGYTTLSQILQTVPGIYISTSERHLRRLAIRNVTSSYNDKALLLVDGIPYREVFYGHLFIDEYFPIEIIKQIEILRGPSSALYGTNAFAGVINIVTKNFSDIDKTENNVKDCEKTKTVTDSGTRIVNNLNIKVGTHDLSEFAVLSAAKFQDGSEVIIYGRKYETKGSGPQYSRKHQRNAIGADPAMAKTFMLKWNYHNLKISTFYFEFQHIFHTNWDLPAEVKIYDFFQYKDVGFDVFYDFNITEKLSVELKLSYQNYDDSSFYHLTTKFEEEPGVEDFIVTWDIWPIKKSQAGFAELHFNYDIFQNNTLSFGIEYTIEEIIDVRDLYIERATGSMVAPDADPAIGPYSYWVDPVTKHNKVFYVQDQQKLGKFDFIVGMRTDIHEVFGTTTSPRAAVVYNHGSRLILKAFYGSAFRAPSYRELFTKVSDPSWIKGNEDLDPESIETKEIEIVFMPNENTSLTLNIFESKITNLIGRGGILGVDEIYENSENEIDIKGIEFTHRVKRNKLQFDLNFSYCEAYDSETNELLPNLPTTQGNFKLIYSPSKNLNLSIMNVYVGSRVRWPDDTNTYYGKPVDPKYPMGEPRPDVEEYFRTDVNVLLDLNNRTRVNLHCFNVFDIKYYDPYYKKPYQFDIQGPGRMVHLSLVYYF